MTTTDPRTHSGLAEVNGLRLYWESRGAGGTPLVLLHGGYGSTALLDHLASALSDARQVISVDLQGHGRTADVDRPLSYETMGDDVAALVRHLELGRVDLLGYSLGGGAALRATIQHPDLVRRLVLVSTVFSRAGWFPDLQTQMAQMDRGLFEMFRQTPLYTGYAAVAPDVDHFPELMDKMGVLLGTAYDWTAEVRDISVPTLLVFGDADSVPMSYAAEFFALLGGGRRDGGWDGAGLSGNQLAILPATTHHTSITSPLLPDLTRAFLSS